MGWLLLFVASPFVGSALGVLIRRLPERRLLTPARSCCEACGRALGPLELVPLASFVALRGRCRTCRAPIDRMHWQVELAALGVAAGAAAASVASGRPDAVGSALGSAWAASLFGWVALALAWIDWEHLVLPDVLTLPLLVLGLWVGVWREPWMATDRALAAAVGYLSLAAVAWGYRRLRKREGIGMGDAKLLAAIGAWVGLEGLAPVLIGAAALGLGGALWLRVSGREVGAATPIPFGPCLAVAGWVAVLAG